MRKTLLKSSLFLPGSVRIMLLSLFGSPKQNVEHNITFFIFILWWKQASIQNTPLLSHLLEIWKYLEIPNSLDFASHRIQCY